MISIRRALGAGALAGALLTALVLVAAPLAQPRFSNNLFLQGANSGSTPAMQAVGTDTNISINLVPKGAGTVQVNGTPITVSGGTFTSLTINPGPLTVQGSFVQTVSTSPPVTATLKAPPLVLAHNITATGNVGAGEDTLHSYTLPANTLSANGQSVQLDLVGFTAANANAKQWRVRWGTGTTVVLDSTSFAMNNSAVRIRCLVTRIAAASQVVACEGYQGPPITTGQAWNVGVGGGHSSQLLAEDLTLAQTITVTGTSAAAADNDLVARSSRVVWYPQGQ